jgi:opacity protein-like surface antigen
MSYIRLGIAVLDMGLGVDADMTQNIRVDLGYRFGGFGNASLVDGRIIVLRCLT